jgi:hypothetical protein
MKRDRWYSKPLELTDEHTRLAGRLVIRWQDDIEWGGPEVDAKRPFGNGDMPGDVAEILGWEAQGDDGELTQAQRDRAEQLHFEMGYVLVVALNEWFERKSA